MIVKEYIIHSAFDTSEQQLRDFNFQSRKTFSFTLLHVEKRRKEAMAHRGYRRKRRKDGKYK